MPFISAVNGTFQEGVLERTINVQDETGLSVVQGETIYISTAALVANDIGAAAPRVISVQNPTGGTVFLNESIVEFTSSGSVGEIASFEYTVSDLVGTATGTAYIMNTGLPPREALIFNLEVDAAAARESDDFVPPTIQDIFNTWARFDGSEYFEGTDSGKSQNASAWQLLENPDRVLMPLNVSPTNGFISPDLVESYVFEATLTSESHDNDTNGLIVAFEREGETNHVLALAVSKGGSTPRSGYGLIYFQNNSGFSDSESTILAQPDFGLQLGAWSGSEIRLRIERDGDIITCYASQYNDSTFDPASKIEFNLNSNSNTQRFKGPKPYGYMTFSQPDSAYIDIVFEGGLIDLSVIYDVENNDVWDYNSETEIWELSNDTAQDRLSFPRMVTNPRNTERFKLLESNIIQYLGKIDGTDSTLAAFDASKAGNQIQNIYVNSTTGGEGVGSGIDVVGLFVSGLEETNLLLGKPTLTTTGEYTNNSNTVGSGSYFNDNGVAIANLIGGNVVFANGTVGVISAITQSTITYTVTTDFDIYDESI